MIKLCPFCKQEASMTYEERRLYKLYCHNCETTVLHKATSWKEAEEFFAQIMHTTVVQNGNSNCVVSVAPGSAVEFNMR